MEINKKKISGKSLPYQTLNNTLLSNKGERRNLKGNYKIFLTEYENTAYQNLWDATRALLRQQPVALNICIRKDKMSEIHDLHFHLKKLEKEDQIKTKVSRREREMMKIGRK